mgnify:CR=1 FL=1
MSLSVSFWIFLSVWLVCLESISFNRERIFNISLASNFDNEKFKLNQQDVIFVLSQNLVNTISDSKIDIPIEIITAKMARGLKKIFIFMD